MRPPGPQPTRASAGAAGWASLVAITAAAMGGCAEDPEVPSDAELLAGRPYRLVAPEAAVRAAQGRAPLVMVLHGYASNAASIEAYYGFGALAAREGFLAVLPEGTRDAAGNRAWNFSPVHFPPLDVAYLRAVIDDVRARHAVDPRRIHVVGVSAGGHMAHRLGCDLSATLAAVVSVAGQVPLEPRQCAPSGPVSVLQVHGDRDRVVGYHGDLGTPPDPSVPSARQTVEVWARNDGCGGALDDAGERLDLLADVDGAETRIERQAGCPDGIGVELWTMEGGSHHPAVQPDWAAQLYGFLRAHPRP
jgi:polyhydroxybutyrate depolymerase